MKDLSESALRPCIELNDVRLSFIKAGWSFDDIFLEDYTRSKIEEIQHIYLESDEEEVDELPFSSLEHQEEKLRQMEYLDLHFIQPYLPDFPRLHTFLSEPVEREFDLDYMAARRFKCLQHKDIMNSKMQKLEKEADTVTLKLVGSNETFVGTLSLLLAVLPPKRKEY
ncbi:hypothetical protein RF11_01486 [Thelohanellus kitauei]|uniref:Transcription factor TFIID subunit 8 C-terminal domain-containing protein n=1 Tax=Thelohanellus kitauei TaxID=669202 RepID=A0A0C2IA49_THEKT|nr:hypothetical protein RF11_01486 [Thelohanellus kitauei]